jgi:hypothetical protein
VPDASTRSSKKYPIRNTYSLETWMDDAIIAVALKRGITQSDVVRECITYGLRELYGLGGRYHARDARTGPSAGPTGTAP